MSFLARIIPPLPSPAEQRVAALPRTLAELVRGLPPEAAAAQVLAVSPRATADPSEVERLARGGFGAVILRRDDWRGARAVRDFVVRLRAAVARARTIQPLVLVVQPGGSANSFPGLPPERPPAEFDTARAAAAAYGRAALTLRRLGVEGLIGLPADVAAGEESVLGTRVFSSDPAEVATFVDLALRACQAARFLCVPGSFPGIGAADRPPEAGPVSVGLGLGDLRKRDLLAFRAAVDSGAAALLVGHALYPFENFAVPASMSRRVLVDLLRGEMRYPGIAITDDFASPAVRDFVRPDDAAVAALRAGADLVWISEPAGSQQAAFAAVLRALRDGRLQRARIDQAVQRILALKRALGLVALPAQRGRGQGRARR